MTIVAEIEELSRRLSTENTESATRQIRDSYNILIRSSPFIKNHLLSIGATAALETLRDLENRLKERELHDQKTIKAKEVARQRYLDNIGVDHQLSTNFLKSDSWFRKKALEGPLPDCDIEALHVAYRTRKLDFVRSWIGANTPPNKDGEPYTPDDEQLEAIASLNGHVQVVARAGSGKTTTLVNRVLFLIKHCKVTPDRILVLAFNKTAASELEKKLLKLIDQAVEPVVGKQITGHARKEFSANPNTASPHIMTFHALAYALVRPEESLLYDGSDNDAQGLSRVFQQVIDDHLREPAFRTKIRELMLAHFRTDWERIVRGRYEQNKEEFIQFRRSLPRQSLDGQHIKSFGEKLIADFLFEHDIAYKYEHNHWWNHTNYRPDFTVFITGTSGVIIEYFGLRGDPDYDERAERKREYWKKKPGWSLIEFSPEDIGDGGSQAFQRRLKIALEAAGVRCTRLSEDEIWYRIRDRAIDRFTTVSVGFVSRARKQGLSADELRKSIESYSPISTVERMFLEIVHNLYKAYLNRLVSTGEDDFDGLMQRAAHAVQSGITAFKRRSGSGNLSSLKYVFIDEFQDFSVIFHRLLVAIRMRAPQAELFCVGDDWQAINGFAGSDLRFFERFEEYAGKSQRLYLSTNYRSANSIVSVGNALMAGLGRPASAKRAVAGDVWLADLTQFIPTPMELQRHSADIITPAVLRLVNTALTANKKVVLLCRTNSISWFVKYKKHTGPRERKLEGFLDHVRSHFPVELQREINISTVHKYKGLESSMVIVLDAVARSYPLIHPDWPFSRILGYDPLKIIEEDRRLLYVALTRAADTLVVITDRDSPSPFLAHLQSGTPMTAVDWSTHSPPIGTMTHLLVRITNQQRYGAAATFAIKDQLKASGYRWRSTGASGWEKSISIASFKLETIKSEVWSRSADGVVVQLIDEADQLLAEYRIDGGNWRSSFDNMDAIARSD